MAGSKQRNVKSFQQPGEIRLKPVEIVMNGVRREKRKCVVCGQEFMGKGRQKTCGHLCSDSPKMLKRKGRKKFTAFLKKQEY